MVLQKNISSYIITKHLCSFQFTLGDPFGTDPFAPTSAKPKQAKSPAPPRPKSKSPAIGRNRSPAPSLPPKHKKAPPPPRPPAPKPSPGSGKPALDPFEGNDPFGGNAATTKGSSGDPFAGNFADFGSNKVSGDGDEIIFYKLSFVVYGRICMRFDLFSKPVQYCRCASGNILLNCLL